MYKKQKIEYDRHSTVVGKDSQFLGGFPKVRWFEMNTDGGSSC